MEPTLSLYPLTGSCSFHILHKITSVVADVSPINLHQTRIPPGGGPFVFYLAAKYDADSPTEHEHEKTKTKCGINDMPEQVPDHKEVYFDGVCF